MNLNKLQKLTKATVAVVSLGLLAVAPAQAANEILTGLTFNGGGAGSIFTFNANAPGTLLSSHFVTGTSGGEVIVGIDYFGNVLYGVGSGGNLYNINQATGVATVIGGASFGSLNGIYFGTDVSAAGVRIVSDLDQNLLVSTAGALVSSTPALNPSSLNIDAISSSGATMYAVDSLANTLNTLNTATGVATTIGAMGYDVSGKNGFDISAATGIAYFSSAVSSSGLDANLYTVNLSTGLATLVGQVGNPGTLVYGLTVVPEPSIAAIFIAGGGGLGLLALARRRK